MTEQTTIHDTLKTKPLSEFTDAEMSAARDLAYQVLRADYYRDVRGVAESITSAIMDKEIADSEALLERIHEECDGAGRVIYTAQAIECLLISDNDSAYAEEFGTEGMISDGAVNWSTLAFFAFERDVIEQLEAEGVDVNDFDPPAEEDESEDGPGEFEA